MKTCYKCAISRPLSDFSFKNKAKGLLSKECRSCQKEYRKLHYQANSDTYKQRARKRNSEVKKETQARIKVYLDNHPCVDCGESDIIVLHFDHVIQPKVDDISRMISNGKSWEIIEAEIAKCVVRCANCHIRKTAKDFNWWKFT